MTKIKKKKSNFKKKSFEKIKNNKTNIFFGIIVLILVISSYYFVGNIDISKSTIDKTNSINLPFINENVNLKDISLVGASIILGLLDGFNPCAMWVLIYLITLAASLKDRRKLFLIVGTFVATEAIMYFFVLAGWLNLFDLFVSNGLSKILLYVVGAFALFTGSLSINDYIKKKGQITCEVGDIASKKKTKKRMDFIMNSPITIASIFATIILAVIVNSVEFVCSAALPAIFSQMLSIAHLNTFTKYLYISIYDFFFMLDDFIIFGLAIWAYNSDWTTKYSGFSKLFGGIIMVIIGFILLFYPQLLY